MNLWAEGRNIANILRGNVSVESAPGCWRFTQIIVGKGAGFRARQNELLLLDQLLPFVSLSLLLCGVGRMIQGRHLNCQGHHLWRDEAGVWL